MPEPVADRQAHDAGGSGRSVVLVSTLERGVALVTLNRPATRNSLSLEMLGELAKAFDGLGCDSTIRAIVLAATGSAFCAGHDLREITAHRTDPDAGEDFFRRTMAACCAVMQAIVACPKPVIAAVGGTATAAGCQLVATCDLAVAAESARFCTPGVNIGLFCSTPMVALSRNVPRKRAMEMLLTGETIDAATAAEWGLVNRIAPADRVMTEALEFARQISARSPLTIAVGKKAFYQQLERPLAEAYELTARVMVENLLAKDAEEGICAFLDKRPPAWTGC
ncbi:MAG: enoyl-CoA hydratase [Hyphomicrobiaceae bacterium]